MSAPARPMSRRALLSGGFLRELLGAPRRRPSGGGGEVPAARSARQRRVLPLLRPPGAIDEAEFLERCTRCDACIEACPEDALARAAPRLGAAAGTPVIDPVSAPCVLCEDRPCAVACDEGAIDALAPARIGTAHIVKDACIAGPPSLCRVCVERCPVEGAIRVEQGRPVVSEETCTGCGICRHACPAPSEAILILPRRPQPVGGGLG